MTLLDILLFSRDRIHKLSPSAMKNTLLEIIELSPEEIIEDVINYWNYKNSKLASSKKMNYEKYGKIIKEITPKRTDRIQFHKEISTYLKKLI